MHELNQELHLLPVKVREELLANVGQTLGLSQIQTIVLHRATAQRLIEQKRTHSNPLPPGRGAGEEIRAKLDGVPFFNPRRGGVYNLLPQWVAYETIRLLDNFSNNLAPVQARLEVEAQERAAQAAAEIERRRVQEEAARLQAQREAEEAARRAAEQAARLLAQQQAEAAARAFAQSKAEEAALAEARLALELSTAPAMQSAATDTSDQVSDGIADDRPAREIVFIPGPTAMAEIDRATLALKHSVDAAVTQYASAIAPCLNAPHNSAATAL